MSTRNQFHHFADGDAHCWMEHDSSIMLKAVTDGDAVELSAEEARELAEALLAMARQLDDLDAPKK
jgi:hypothetical protein